MPDYEREIKYYLDDYHRSLFPLETSRLVISHKAEEILHIVYKLISKGHDSFLPQLRVYASKQGMQLRRTVKLDPIAEFFIYYVVYKNRQNFRKDLNNNRKN